MPLEHLGAGIMLSAPSGRALFIKRSPTAKDYPGEWGFPFGSAEPDETPEETARRETQEETGLTVGDMTRLEGGNGYVTFRANVDTEAEPTLNHEHTEHQWASIDNPPQPLHPGVAATLSRLSSGAADTKIGGGKSTEGFEQNAQKLKDLQRQNENATGLDAFAQDKREWDTNGWFEVRDNPLSTIGVYQYSEASVIKGGDPRKMVNVYRSEDELSNPETVKSFRLMPWTDDHPDALLGDADRALVPAEQKGVHGVIGEQTYYRDGTLYGNIKVFSEQLARKIAAGKRELSCGYRCDFVPQEGVYNGTAYQYVQKNLRGNHVASVRAGRMGSGVRVLDAAENLTISFALDLKESDMTACKDCGRVHAPSEDCMDEEATRMVADSFNSLVGKLETKGYSKEYATKVAGKVAAEKGTTGHDSQSTGETTMAKDANVKDPEGKEDPNLKKDLEGGSTTKDSMTEEETGMDAKADEEEAARDAAEEEKEKADESPEAKDRRRARDRRAGARDARKAARDRAAARDKAAKDAARDAAMRAGKGMDAAEVAAIVKREVAAAVPDTATLVKTIRKEEAAKLALYGRISPVIGAFDHSEMTHADMAAYGLKKLGAPETSDPVTALDFYLAGRGAAAQAHTQRSAQDASASSGSADFLDKYLAA